MKDKAIIGQEQMGFKSDFLQNNAGQVAELGDTLISVFRKTGSMHHLAKGLAAKWASNNPGASAKEYADALRKASDLCGVSE
jgi:hypothetical protein